MSVHFVPVGCDLCLISPPCTAPAARCWAVRAVLTPEAVTGDPLPARGPSPGKSDPYCELTMGSQVQRTPVVEGTLNPRWNHSMQFMVKDVRDDVLCISVFDRDYFSPNGEPQYRYQDRC